MRRTVVVVGTAPVAAAAAAALRRREDVDVALGAGALAGATLVVHAGGPLPSAVAVSAPSAVVVVAGGGAEVDACLQATLHPRTRVLGTGGVAATARWRALLAAEAGVSVRDVTGLVLGGAGAAAVPAVSLATVAGAPASAVLGEDAVEALAARLRDERFDEHDAAAAVAEVACAVLDDARRVLPCAVRCHGELGIGGSAVAVPAVVGAAGAEAILELPLTDAERAAVSAAVA